MEHFEHFNLPLSFSIPRDWDSLLCIVFAHELKHPESSSRMIVKCRLRREKKIRKTRRRKKKANHIKNEWKEANKVAESWVLFSYQKNAVHYNTQHIHLWCIKSTISHISTNLFLWRLLFLSTTLLSSLFLHNSNLFLCMSCFFLKSSLDTRLAFRTIFFAPYCINFSTHYWVDPDFKLVIVTIELKLLIRLQQKSKHI